MRFGYALGLHIRNEDRNAGAAKKEVLSRIWWSHYTLESTLAVLTGRPSLRVDKGCSVPLPLPISSEEIDGTLIESKFGSSLAMSTGLLPRERNATAPSGISAGYTIQAISDYSPSVNVPANSGSYLRCVIKLGEITHAALNLYASGAVGESWRSVQKLIEVMTEEIEMWATTLPDGLNFSNRDVVSEHPYKREQITLAFLYHSTRILITRPCLCRLDRRIKRQSATSKVFNQSTALTCLESAKSIARLLPDDPELDSVQIYLMGPWWTMVHNIMQSLVVLILDISYESQQFPDDPQEILAPLKKLTRWLRAMRLTNAMARRAYSIVVGLLKKVVKVVKIVSKLQYSPELPSRPWSGPIFWLTRVPRTYSIFWTRTQKRLPQRCREALDPRKQTITPSHISKPRHRNISQLNTEVLRRQPSTCKRPFGMNTSTPISKVPACSISQRLTYPVTLKTRLSTRTREQIQSTWIGPRNGVSDRSPGILACSIPTMMSSTRCTLMNRWILPWVREKRMSMRIREHINRGLVVWWVCDSR